MIVDITGYITKAYGNNEFTIKITSDNVTNLSLSDIQVSKEVKVFIKPRYYPFDDRSEFIPVGRDENREKQIDKYISLSKALKKGDRVKCSVCIVETETRNGQEVHVINRNRNDIETYAKFPLWLYSNGDSFERLKVDSRESLKFRKQWFYTCLNREKCEEITGSEWNKYRDKPWINKHPIRTFPRICWIRFKTTVSNLWEWLTKQETLLKASLIVNVILAIITAWSLFFKNP